MSAAYIERDALAIYEALREVGTANEDWLAAHCHISRFRVAAHALRLERLGLIDFIGSSRCGGRYRIH